MAATYALPAELTIYSTGTSRAQFQKWLAKLGKSKRAVDTPLAVDASGVIEIDGAGMQLLVALAHSLAAKRRPLRLANPSHTLTSACEVLGLSALLLTPTARTEQP